MKNRVWIALLAAIVLIVGTAGAALAQTATVDVPDLRFWLGAPDEETAAADGATSRVWRIVMTHEFRTSFVAAYDSVCAKQGFPQVEGAFDSLGFGAKTYAANGVVFTLTVDKTEVRLEVDADDAGLAAEEAAEESAAAVIAAVAAAEREKAEREKAKPTPTPKAQPDSDMYCADCHGTGHCWKCGGSGTLINVLKKGADMLSECPKCHGGKDCPACGGSGLAR